MPSDFVVEIDSFEFHIDIIPSFDELLYNIARVYDLDTLRDIDVCDLPFNVTEYNHLIETRLDELLEENRLADEYDSGEYCY